MRISTVMARQIAALATLVPLAATAAPGPGPGERLPSIRSSSPLAAAAWSSDHDQIELLLAAGEDPNERGNLGITPWLWSLAIGDRVGFRRLFDAVTDFRPQDPITVVALLLAVEANDGPAVRELIDKGVSVDARGNDGTTPLMLAAANGLPGVIALLVDRRAQVNLQDQFGDTALMAAVRAGSMESLRKLLASGADVNKRDKEGRTALAYADRSGRQDVRRLLLEAGAMVDAAPAAMAAPPSSPKAAVARSLPLLERATAQWIDGGRGCNACHVQPAMVRVAAVARAQGFPVGASLLSSLDRSVHEELGADFARYARAAMQTREGVTAASMRPGGDQVFILAWNLATLLDAGLPRRPADVTSARLLARMQRPDGSFRHGPNRVPLQSTDIASTALAVRVLQAYAPRLRGDDPRARLAKARAWLLASVPRTTDEAAFRLQGLHWLKVERALIDQAAATLVRLQLPNGGWPQVPGLNADAYATGLALVALHEAAGLPARDPVYARGVQHLLATQYPDGSWLVHKRSVPANKYFESGFPHGKFQFSSFVGSTWATMALMYGHQGGGLAARDTRPPARR